MAVAPDSTSLDPSGRLMIRPSVAGAKTAALFAVMSAVFGAAVAGVRPMTFAVLALLTAVLLMSWAAITYGRWATTWVIADHDQIVVKHPLRAAVTVQVRDIAKVFRCSRLIPGGRSGPSYQPVDFAFSSASKCVISFNDSHWKVADLDQLWQFVGLKPEGSYGQVVTDGDLQRMFPGAF
jgi:hypothetical protein